MLTTNYDHWQKVCQDIESPQSFVDMAFYFTISAVLQRRVWTLGGVDSFGWPQSRSVFPNLYVMLTGPAGIGKGRVLKEAFELITHWKTKAEHQKYKGTVHPTEQVALDLRIPSHTGSITFPKLVEKLATKKSICNFKTKSGAKRSYVHNSYALLCEEFDVLFRKINDTDDLSNFLLQAWDCGEFIKEKMSDEGGKGQFIRYMCLAMIAGTTPVSMKENFSKKLLSDGFAARTLFIYGQKERKLKFQASITEETLEARKALEEHVKNLLTVYGPVPFTPEALNYMVNWYESGEMSDSRVNSSNKLDGYYKRKKVHVSKISMAVHFAEKTSLQIDLEDVLRAREVLDSIELTMHQALDINTGNPLNDVLQDILVDIKTNKKMKKGNISLKYYDRVDARKLNEILQTLIEQELVTVKNDARGKAVYTAI